MTYLLITCLIIIGFLGYKLSQKQKLDKEELKQYQLEISDVRRECHELSIQLQTDQRCVAEQQAEYSKLKEQCDYEKYKLEECKKDLQTALDTYNDLVDNKIEAIDQSIEEQREKRQKDLELELSAKEALIARTIEDKQNYCDKQISLMDQTVEDKHQEALEQIDTYNKQISEQQERFASIERILRQYELDKQAKLFYTIQLPDEFKEDIEFLLTTVAAKVQHPDIISKLVWAEYVKPYIEDTFKRIEIKPEAGIYKLTNIETGKAYVGKSTNVKTRIADHFKSSVGIKSIADQAVHHAILKEGFWNWSIEVITYCDKDQLSELEKYYIEFFKTQEFGYNKNAGG